ncbi:MAG: glycosyltransferase, partial [Firmicutes bacterium]|nr:glycosyltransferase [Bacillota bacterium]
FLMSFASFSIAVIYLILKLIFWYSFPVGIAPLIILVSIIGSVQLFFIGLLGEYILNINKRLMNRPLVIEEERINFDTE